MAARRIWRDVANVVWYYITHLQAEINNRAVYMYIYMLYELRFTLSIVHYYRYITY